MRDRRAATTLATIFVAVALAAVACGSDGESSEAPPPSTESGAAGRTFVGRVDGTNASVAIQLAGDAAQAYVCDGQGIWGFLEGGTSNGQTALFSQNGAYRVTATAAGGSLTGTVLLKDGSEHAFTAVPAEGNAGLYQLQKSVGGQDYTARWVRTNDGAVRGKVTQTQTAQAADAETADEVTGGTGGEEVPPAAQPAPQPTGGTAKKNLYCTGALLFANDYVKKLNAKGGADKATQKELQTLIGLHIDVDTYCGAGTSDDTSQMTPLAP